MIRSFLKRKLTDNQLANIFVNGLLEVIDNGFKDVALLINEDPAFDSTPNITSEANSEFTLIIIVGNLVTLESSFDSDQAFRVEKLIYRKFATIFSMDETSFENLIKDYKNSYELD